MTKPIECGAWNERPCNFAESVLNNTGARFGKHPEALARQRLPLTRDREGA